MLYTFLHPPLGVWQVDQECCDKIERVNKYCYTFTIRLVYSRWIRNVVLWYTIPCPIIDVPPIISKCYRVGNVAVQKWYLFDCSQMLPLISFLLHSDRLNICKIMPQNVRDHVYHTGAESKSFYLVGYVFIKGGCGCGCGCKGA